MSTRSYVGVLQADGRTYRVRYAHFDGAPGTMPYLIAAVWWHTFGGDDAATVAALLAHDWQQIGPDITADTPPSMPDYRAIPGVGMAMPAADTAPQPLTGQLPDVMPRTPIRWMHLIDTTSPGRLLICAALARSAQTTHWVVRHHLDLSVGRDVVVDAD